LARAFPEPADRRMLVVPFLRRLRAPRRCISHRAARPHDLLRHLGCPQPSRSFLLQFAKRIRHPALLRLPLPWDYVTGWLGLSKTRIMISVLLPQAFRSALPAIGGQNILLLRGTALASTITVFELMGAANLVRADLSGLRASVRRGSWIFLASGIDHGWFRFFRETTCSTVSSGTGSDHLFIPHRVH